MREGRELSFDLIVGLTLGGLFTASAITLVLLNTIWKPRLDIDEMMKQKEV